jgi:beta-glucanase (GH16 family)
MKRFFFTIILSLFSALTYAIDTWEPITDHGASFVPPGYVLAFNDEFNGTALNRNRWFTRYIYDGGKLDQLTGEAQRYRDNDNHVLGGGVLALTAHKVGDGYGSGMLRSKWEFKPSDTVSYYVEGRFKMPAGRGVFGGFWLNSGYGPGGKLSWGPEIDIFEWVVNGVEDNPGPKHNMLTMGGVAEHEGRNPSTLVSYSSAYSPHIRVHWAANDLIATYNTVGLEWTATHVTWFVNGKEVVKRTYRWNYDDNGQPAGPAHILINLALGGKDWAGRYGIDDSAFPQAVQVDWVRAYKKLVK